LYNYILIVIKKIVMPSFPLSLCLVMANIFARVVCLSQKPEVRFLAGQAEELLYTIVLKFFGAPPDYDRAFCQRIYYSELGPFVVISSFRPDGYPIRPAVFLPLILFFVLNLVH
jgi:hypothetical protein